MPDDAAAPPSRRFRWHRNWLVRDFAVFLPITVLTIAAGLALTGAAAPVQGQVQQMLTLLAVAGTVGAALVVSFAGRLDRDVTALRIGSGLLVYGGVVLPVTAAGFATSIGPAGQLLDLIGLGAVAVLFALGLVRRGEPTLSWPAAAVAVAASLTAVAGTALVPALAPGTMVLTAAHAVIVLGMAAVAAAMVAQGMRAHSVLQRRVGLGYGLLAVAHGGRGLEPVEVMMAWPAFTGLRPVAVAIIIAGVLPHLRSALRRQQDRDVAAALRLQAVREAGEARDRDADDRDHELRNVVLGLSGAAALLAGPADGGRAELGAAVAAELDRLTRMLDRARPETGAGEIDVRSALAVAVEVRRAGGAVIELDVPAGLRARGSAEVLTQVVTNLLVNCARHAPGSPVHISAAEADGHVVVQVRDHGPGIAPGREADLLDRGRRSATTGGRGLGLGISRDLLRAHGGDLRLVRPAGGGLLAVLDIPSAELAAPVTRFAS